MHNVLIFQEVPFIDCIAHDVLIFEKVSSIDCSVHHMLVFHEVPLNAITEALSAVNFQCVEADIAILISYNMF